MIHQKGKVIRYVIEIILFIILLAGIAQFNKWLATIVGAIIVITAAKWRDWRDIYNKKRAKN